MKAAKYKIDSLKSKKSFDGFSQYRRLGDFCSTAIDTVAAAPKGHLSKSDQK